MECSAISDSPSENLSSMNFPSDVHKWMKINAKPKMALKLMQVCKYFQHSDGFPYFVVKEVNGGFRWLLGTLDGKTIEIKNLEQISKKLWIIGIIDIYGLPKDVSTLLRKTAVLNIKKIRLSRQRITFDEFKFLTDGGMVEVCVMIQTKIISENDEIVPLKDIFECLPNARIISFRSEVPSIFSLGAAEVKLSSKLEKLNLWISSTTFDHQKLFTFMKNYQKIQYTVVFNGVSTEEFEQNITPSVNKMIQEWSPEYKVPSVFHH